MKMLRFLGFFGILCAFGFVGTPAYANSTSTGGNGQPECTDGVCQICDGDKCTNICETGYWGLGGNSSVCTPCTTNPGQAYPNSLYSTTYIFNRSVGACYKYCGANTCIDISNSSNQKWTDYGLSNVSIAPFDSEAGNQNIGFYEFASNPGSDACDTGTDYCPIIMTCGVIDEACKPRTLAVTFMNGNTTVGTLYVVRDRLWSSRDTNFQINDRLWSSRDTNFQINGGNTASYSGVVFPIFRAPTVDVPEGYEFTGFYDDPSGGNQIIGADGKLTQANAATAEAVSGHILYAHFQKLATPTAYVTCSCGFYLPANSATCTLCPAGSFCTGGTFDTPVGVNQGITTCVADTTCAGSTSNQGSCAATDCYIENTVQCTSPNSNCPTYPNNPNYCNYLKDKVSCIKHLYGKSGCLPGCDAGDTPICLVTSCPADYWYNGQNVCTHCDTGYSQPNNNHSGGESTCTKTCTVPCDKTLPVANCPDNATCTPDVSSNAISGTTNQTASNMCFDSQTPSQPIVAGACDYSTVLCNEGYTLNSQTHLCEENTTCSRITFADNNNGGASTNANIRLYRKSGDTTNWYKDDKCTNIISNPQVGIPNLTGYTFLGYFTKASDGIEIFKSNGTADPTNTSSWNVTAPITLQAQWGAGVSKVMYKCSDDASSYIEGQAATYGQSYDLSAGTICSNPNHRFTKWRAVNDVREYVSEEHINSWDYTDAYVTFVAQWEQLYIVQCPSFGDSATMYQWSQGYNEALTLNEQDMNKICYHTCPENQEQDGWDIYLNGYSLPAATVNTYPIEITGGVSYSGANLITLQAHCEEDIPDFSITYTCGDGTGNETNDTANATWGQDYTVLDVGDTYCQYANHEFYEWTFSETSNPYVGGSTINWQYGGNTTFTAQWQGTCNLITFDDNNAQHTNVNENNPQRKRTDETPWYFAGPHNNINACGKSYEGAQPHVEIPENGDNATFLGYFDPNDLDLEHAIFGVDGYPTRHGNDWTISSSIILKALWQCDTGYYWDASTHSCKQSYIVQCPGFGNPNTMYQVASLAYNEHESLLENDLNKMCYHTCPANQEQDGWDIYLNGYSLPADTVNTYPIEITGGVSYSGANLITLQAHCVTTKTSATYLCYKNDEGTVDNEVTLVNYAVRPLSWYAQCNINPNNFNGWLFSGDDAMHAADSTISPWTWDANQIFVPAYEASFDCNTTHWQAPSGGNHTTQRVVLGDGLTMPTMNCEPRAEYAGWLPDTTNWTSAYTSGLTSPIPGATCSTDISVAGGGNFSWSCPTDLTFTPNDDLITQTINLTCGSNSDSITVSYGDNISAMVTQWFADPNNCPGGPCAYPTNPTTYAHGYWKICADWPNNVTPPNLTPVDGEPGCYRTDPAHPSYDFSQLDQYWNQISNFSVTSIWRCPKWVKYKCTANSEALYQDNMSYAAYYEEPYIILNHETVGCGDTGYAFTKWYEENQPSTEYDENGTVQSWPYDDVVTLVGKYGNANDYNIIYHSLGGADMNTSGLCQHTFTHSDSAQDFNPDISGCVPTRELSTFLGWCESSNTTNCTPIERIPAGQSADLHLYAIWECVPPYHSNTEGTACEACADDLYWNGEACESCATDAPGFPRSKHPFTWSIKTCYRECPSDTILGASGQTCNANANMYGLNCPINVNFAQFSGSTGKQVEFYGNYTDGINTCNNPDNAYCPHGLFCGNATEVFKPMTAPVNFYDAAGHQTFGTRYIFGSRGDYTTIDLGTGKLWSLLAGSGQKTDVIHNDVGGVPMDYQYTYIIYPTYAAPTPDDIAGMAFDGYYSAQTGGMREVLNTLGLDNANAMSIITDTTGNSNTARKVYARYSNIDYTLTYNCGTGGTGNPTPPQDTGIHYGDPIVTAANTCQNPGHDFRGWVVSPAGGIKQQGDSFTWQYTENQVFTADWSGSIIYNIDYDLYGGTASDTGMPRTYTYESGAVINGVPTRDHSTFDGWCTDATLTSCALTQTIAPNTETGDKTFYAKWKCEPGYVLTGNLCYSESIKLVYANGGHGVAPTEPSSCTYGQTFYLPAAIVPNPADGYTFNKWTVNGNNFGAGIPIACDYTNLGVYQGTVTITATWNANDIVIDWNENGGATIPNGNCIYNGNLALANAPLYEGHTFNGWLLADGTTYANANSTQTGGCVAAYIGVTSGTSTAITAQWCENCIQPEHGSCTLTPQMNGQCIYTTSCDDGYDISGDGTATPICTPHMYTITYRPNGGTPATDQTQSVNYLADFTTFGATTFSKENSLLTGWHKVSGGNFSALSTRYTYDATTDTVLDAVWDECTCINGIGVETCETSVSNNACQGVATCQSEYINPSVVCQGTTCNAACSHCPEGTIPNGDKECQPCPPGTFQFGDSCKPCADGYISGEGATACDPCDDGYSANADHTACDPNTITIVYTNGGHGVAPGQTSCQYGQTFTLADAIIAEGYTFNKWSVNNNTFDANERITCDHDNLGVYGGTATITATWNSTMYQVTFDANGGTGGQSAPVQAAYNQPMPTISNEAPVNTGYTFMGWYDNANYLSGTQYYNANGVGTRVYDKTTGTTLYAGWSPNIITLVYDANGHGTAPSSRTCTYGSDVQLASEIFAEGFLFKNWKVGNRTFNANATITCNIENLGVSSGSVTLVAQWDPRTYIVEYNCGAAGGNAPDSTVASYNENFTPALHNSCQYHGHAFTGWKVSNTNDIRTEGVAFKWLYLENKTLIAQWDAQTYDILYELNGGTNYTSAPHSYIFGIGATINGTPTRANSVFKGWCSDIELQNCAMSQTISRTEMGDKEFYAKWTCTNGYIPNAANTACDACEPGQHAENGQCVDNVIECTLPDATYATRTWNAANGAYGPCIVAECVSDYHLVSNTCVKDTRTCTLEHGYGTQDWNGTDWGKCIAETCESGFEIVGDYCEECSNRRLDGAVVVSSYANGCEIASCMYHGQKYTLENNECVPICETKSDETGSMVWNESRKKCVRTCNPGYKMW